jgi:hypothetical protein
MVAGRSAIILIKFVKETRLFNRAVYEIDDSLLGENEIRLNLMK